jgi:hypothetical protein
VGIAATGFCYPGGILQLFHRRDQQIFSTSSRSTTHTAEDSWSKDTEQYEEIKQWPQRKFLRGLQDSI